MNGVQPERPAFGALLRKRRIAARLSQEQLAERARISVQAVSALERGARHAPRPDTLELLVRSLALDGADLVEFETTARASIHKKIRHGAAPEREIEGIGAYARGPIVETSFIGREREVREVVRALATRRCVTLWGPGGVGKTRLAIESLPSLATTFGNRIAFGSLANAFDEDSIVRAIAAAFDLDDGDLASLAQHVANRFPGSRTLLVLDNCEQAVAHVAWIVTAALARLPDLRVLVTSREPLRIDSEYVLRIGALDVPAPGAQIAEIVSHDAVRLFLDRAARSGEPSRPFPHEFASLATVCRRLDGLPLAIELAAARTRSMSVAEIERALDERFALLSRGNRNVDSRHRTLRSTIAWSYDLLDTTERIVFERVALIDGPFAMEHAVAIAVDARLDRSSVVDTVAALVDKALLVFSQKDERDDRDGTYAMMESTRLYATSLENAERADADRAAAQRRFGEFFLERSIEIYRSFVRCGIGFSNGIDVDHLRGYLRWAIDEDGDVATAATIVGSLASWLCTTGSGREGLRWAQAALAKLPSDDAACLRARTALLCGTTALLRLSHLGHEAVDVGFEAYASASEIVAETEDDRRLLARAAALAADSAGSLGRHAEAETLLRRSMEIYEALGDGHGSARCLNQLASIAQYAHEYDRSRRAYLEAIACFDRFDAPRLAAAARNNLAEVYFALGDVALAVEAGRAAAESLLEFGSSYFIAGALANLTVYLLEVGSMDEAADAAERTLDVACEAGFASLVAHAIESCATIAAMRGRDVREAALLYGYARPRAGDPSGNFTEERHEARLHSLLCDRLAPADLEAAMASGRNLSEDRALALARASLVDRTGEKKTPGATPGVSLVE